MLDNAGERVPREDWTTDYVSSEDADGGNHTGDKIFDLQESTYWCSGKGAKFPHMVVIDLGKTVKATAVQYLPRMEPGAPGALKNVRIYMK